MSDETWPPVTGDDAELSAYLEGDLDDLAARRLESRLAADPELAARLDRLAELIAELRGVADVELPEGLARRIEDGVATALPAAGAPSATEAAGPPAADRVSAPGPVSGWPAHWPRRAALVAAAVAAVALVGSVTFLGSSGGGDDAAQDADGEITALDRADDAAGSDGADAPQEQAESQAAPEASGGLTEEEAADTGEESAAADADVGTLDGASERDPRDAVPSASGLTDGAELLGMDADEAARVAAERWQAIEEGPRPAGGANPGACRSELAARPGDLVVPIEVAAGTIDGREALAYLVAAGSDGALERLEVVSVDPATCEVLDRREVEGP